VKTICYSRNADAALAKMGAKQAGVIEAKIDQYAADPVSLSNNVKALRGTDALRLRVGDYRVIFDEDMNILDILAIGHRREIYD
jgi:mRNA interferase RelE/StbE